MQQLEKLPLPNGLGVVLDRPDTGSIPTSACKLLKVSVFRVLLALTGMDIRLPTLEVALAASSLEP